jgi:hypothetical protein
VHGQRCIGKLLYDLKNVAARLALIFVQRHAVAGDNSYRVV